MRLLIVEDDPEMRRLLNLLLEAHGYQISTASDGASALVEVSSNEPDLVLLDIGLGDDDGREVLEELRRVSDVPVVFLTGRGLEMDRIAGLKISAAELIPPDHGGEEAAAGHHEYPTTDQAERLGKAAVEGDDKNEVGAE